jgi:hypothetical protein
VFSSNFAKKSEIELNPPGFFLESGFLHWQGPFSELRTDGISIALFGNREWTSPLRAPYGGFVFDGGFSPDAFRSFLKLLDQKAQDSDVSSLEIQAPPEYSFKGDFMEFSKILEQNGFVPMFTDLNFHLPVDRSFIEHLHRSERWKWLKSMRLGFSFRQVLQPDLHLVYNFILASRFRKGYQLSMSREALESVFTAFPERYRVWEVQSPDLNPAAMAVSVWVSEDVEYLFYTADDPAFRFVSPVVMLHEGLYRTVSIEGKKILDLGTASLQGEVNEGVADFKRFLGGRESRKIRFRKVWK